MPADEMKPAIGGRGGGTSGTGQPQATPERAGARPARPHGDTAVREPRESGAEPSSLAAGDDSTAAAIGRRGGGRRTAGTGSSVERSGRLSTEGTGKDLPNPPDAGDPGGMGGTKRRVRAHDSPPGGVSPVASDRGDESDQ